MSAELAALKFTESYEDKPRLCTILWKGAHNLAEEFLGKPALCATWLVHVCLAAGQVYVSSDIEHVASRCVIYCSAASTCLVVQL